MATLTPVPASLPAAPAAPSIQGAVLKWERHGLTERNWSAVAVDRTGKDGTTSPFVDVAKHGLFTSNPRFDPKDRYDVAVAREAVKMVSEKSGQLHKLLGGSNVSENQFNSNTVRPGEYSLALYGEQDKPLYYVGLLKTAPAPLNDLIAGMEALRERI